MNSVLYSQKSKFAVCCISTHFRDLATGQDLYIKTTNPKVSVNLMSLATTNGVGSIFHLVEPVYTSGGKDLMLNKIT